MKILIDKELCKLAAPICSGDHYQYNELRIIKGRETPVRAHNFNNRLEERMRDKAWRENGHTYEIPTNSLP